MYHVSPAGLDDHPGTLQAPLATLQRAADLSQAGDTVRVHAGTYRETVIVPRSGAPGSPIVFEAAGDGEVILSGADVIVGWGRHSGDIWKASVPWDMGENGAGNTLFVDGVLCFEACEGAEGDPIRFRNWGQIPAGALTSTHFTAPDLKGWGDAFWNGARVRHHRNDWTIMSSTIADYDSRTGRVTFAKPVGVVSQKHVVGYSITGTIKALDKPGEWFKDGDTLYYQAEPGSDPNDRSIEFRRRPYAFDLRGRDHIHIKGFTFRGQSVLTDGDTDYLLCERNRFYAYDKGREGRLHLGGTHGVLRDSELSHTWGSAVFVGGRRNDLINNYIHDIGYGGTTRVLSMSGEAHLVSHNTVRTFARSFLDGYPYRSEFAYNLFEDGANLSWDTGVFDGDRGRGNGGGCIVHHNVFRNTRSIGIYCASYAGIDLVFHHNIVYDLTPTTLRAGQLVFLKYYHNTLIGPAPTGNVDGADLAVEASYSNNLQIATDNVCSLGVQCEGNRHYTPEDFVDFSGRDFRLARGSKAIDAGIVLPGVNDGYAGTAPDAGALEYGQDMWKVGHDVEHPPRPTYSWVALPGTNIFTNGQFSREPTGWSASGSPEWFWGNAWNTVGTGLSRSGGHCFRLKPGDGIRRTFDALKPNTWYTVGVEARLADQVIDAEQYDGIKGEVTAADHRGENYVQGLTEGEWLRYQRVDFGRRGQYDTMELSYSRPAGTPYPRPEAALEVRLGRPDGELLGAFAYSPNVVDSWYAAQLVLPRPLGGEQSVVLIGRGPGADLIRLAAVRLLHSNPAPGDRLTVRVENAGAPPVITRAGDANWRWRFDKLAFRTGPDATSADVVIGNDGLYDAYLDRLAFYEKVPKGHCVEPKTIERAPGTCRVDLGAVYPMYEMHLSAPQMEGRRLQNIRVSVYENWDPADPAPVWQRDYLTGQALVNGETLVIKPGDASTGDGGELQHVSGRVLGIEALGNQPLHLSGVEIIAFDETDLVRSDGIVNQTDNTWQVDFPQIINVGELTVRPGKTSSTSLREVAVSIWDRPPDDDGRILWRQTFHLEESLTHSRPFVLHCDAIGSDGATRLASVPCRTVMVQGTGAHGSKQALPLLVGRIRNTVNAPPRTNLALWGTATQSSSHYTSKGHAEAAINGVILPRSDLIHTRKERGAWWQVDLGQTPRIDQIVLFNRKDAAERIGEFRVSAWTADPRYGGTEVWGRNYSYAAGDLPAAGALTINGSVDSKGTRLDELRDARVVRIQLHGENFLSLSEVQVWGRGTRPGPEGVGRPAGRRPPTPVWAK